MITFSGIFTETDIEEIKKNAESEQHFYNMHLFVTSSKQTQKELTKWRLTNQKIVYVYDTPLTQENENIEKVTMNASELKRIFKGYFRERYGVVPRFEVEIDAFVWLPVVVNFQKKSDEDRTEKEQEEFERFFRMFNSDMDAIKNKHEGEEFEYGDKLLQLIYGNYIGDYHLIGAKSGGDTVFTEDDYNGAVMFTVYRDRHVIKRTYYGFNPDYTETYKEEVRNLILNREDATALRNHIKKGFHLYTSLKDGMYALHLAVKERKYNLVKILLEEAVDIDRKDNNGNAPLAYAIINNDIRMIDFLISYHADFFGLTTKSDNVWSLSQNEETQEHMMRYL